MVDVIKEEAERDYQMIAGISEDVEPSDNVFVLTRARIPWLVIGMLGGITGANIIGLFVTDIKSDPRIALFLPLIAAMGGNVGVQSSSIVVQGLASKSLDLDSTWKKLGKELTIGMFIGLAFACLILSYSYFLSSNSLPLTITVSLALFIVILFASVFGTFIPIILNRLKIDPALATGPFITRNNFV